MRAARGPRRPAGDGLGGILGAILGAGGSGGSGGGLDPRSILGGLGGPLGGGRR
ncbi:hypothetical protein [Xylanimonas sp. McL0601]|uniref:hypothetical protein n=1 Tax=Xylanimonas sp. McL0601 TaxID=3414739 RepID=UPI003CEBE33E